MIHFGWVHRSGRILSHAVALAAGSALTLTFVLHAIPSSRPGWDRPFPAPANAFDRELQAATVRMGSEMCITPTGDPDVDFARAMIPHHLGAIEMARLELLHGSDGRLRRLAQGIVVEQSQEIALMRTILDTQSTAPRTSRIN